MIAVLYYSTPNVRLRGFKWVSPGAGVAILVAIVASAAFAFYVANFGSYNKTYGALAGVVIFLIWFWLINVALLFGIELDAEIERTKELKEGVPRAAKEIQLDARARPEAPADDLSRRTARERPRSWWTGGARAFAGHCCRGVVPSVETAVWTRSTARSMGRGSSPGRRGPDGRSTHSSR